ncbi:hypothetical protein [Pseudomonas putida]|uniref:hypothetical protein n=1 Tax=Pseudomonas putida TaxID=303 RepID=UPI000A5AF992|nr:hypothetical protein [Pseudomonas putida]
MDEVASLLHGRAAGSKPMISKNFYRPLDAAILWSNLQEHYSQITDLALYNPQELKTHFPQWPALHTYVERIYDAIARQELPASFLGKPVESFHEAIKPYITIRHADFRIWIDSFYPDDIPIFLLNNADKHASCIPLAIFLTQKARLDATSDELISLRQHLIQLEQELSACRDMNNTNRGDGTNVNTSRETDTTVLYIIIGSLLAVSVGKSASGRVRSIYKNQTAIVEAITLGFPKTPGLSKRTLDRKFAEARRHLDQASRL